MNTGLKNGRKERLTECAKIAFARKGYYSTTISEIVQQAGIARGTFYQYFDNKQHLFQSILDSFLQDLQGRIRPVSLGHDDPPPFVQLQGNLTRVLSLVLGERDLSQILLHHTGTVDRTLEEPIGDFYQQVAEMIQRSLNLGIAMKLVRPCDTGIIAYSIIGSVKEVVLQLTSSQKPQPPVEELVRELMEFGMGGILAENRSSVLGNPHPSVDGNVAVRSVTR